MISDLSSRSAKTAVAAGSGRSHPPSAALPVLVTGPASGLRPPPWHGSCYRILRRRSRWTSQLPWVASKFSIASGLSIGLPPRNTSASIGRSEKTRFPNVRPARDLDHHRTLANADEMVSASDTRSARHLPTPEAAPRSRIVTCRPPRSDRPLSSAARAADASLRSLPQSAEVEARLQTVRTVPPSMTNSAPWIAAARSEAK